MRILTFILFILLAIQCNNPLPIVGRGSYIVEYNGEKLTREDLQKILPETYTKEDSVIMVEAYIKRWLQKKISVENATGYISDSQLIELEHQIKEYKEDLILNRYYNSRLEKLNENSIPESELKQYYEANKHSFILNFNIVKADYYITSLKNKTQLLEWINSNNQQELNTFCSHNTETECFTGNQWISFPQLQSQLNFNDEEYSFQKVQNQSIVEYEKNNKFYYIHFKDFLPQTEIAPFEYYKNTILSILINKRKLNLQKQIEDSLYDDAIKNNKIKYND